MNETRHFRNQLTEDGINTIARRHGFRGLEATEKWILDFDAYNLMR